MRDMKRLVLIASCILFPTAASAQRFTFGAQGGIPAQTPLGRTDDKMPFSIGPTLEMRLFRDLSLASGVTFSRAGRRSDRLVAGVPEDGFVIRDVSSRSRAIEIPLLAKYRVLDEDRTWRPFVTAGATIRRTTIETTTLSSILSGAPITGNPVPRENSETVKWNPDPTVGIGVDVRAGRFHLEPEVRYSYWGAGKHTLVRKNQVQFLLGFRF